MHENLVSGYIQSYAWGVVFSLYSFSLKALFILFGSSLGLDLGTDLVEILSHCRIAAMP